MRGSYIVSKATRGSVIMTRIYDGAGKCHAGKCVAILYRGEVGWRGKICGQVSPGEVPSHAYRCLTRVGSGIIANITLG